MPTIKLKLKEKTNKSYKIFIEPGISKKIPDLLNELKIGKKYAIITDSIVKKLFGIQLQKILKRKGIKSELIDFKQGESSKTIKTVEELAEKMVTHGFTRRDAIIALGGGVTGDIAGFLASIYMRGIPYIQIPTSLLAMVDSAIGGKTGVDMQCGKNLLGSIIQPRAVFIDIDYLKNLPDKQIRNGLAEIIKYGIIKDKKLFKFIEQNHQQIFKKDKKALEFILQRSIQTKVDIVKKDEKENKDLRALLNYGHTYGHALEMLSNYKLLHGYAISIGMVIANKIAVKKGFLKEKEAERIKNLFKIVELPVTTAKTVTDKDIKSDKKREGKFIKLVLIKKIGKAFIHKEPCQ